MRGRRRASRDHRTRGRQLCGLLERLVALVATAPLVLGLRAQLLELAIDGVLLRLRSGERFVGRHRDALEILDLSGEPRGTLGHLVQPLLQRRLFVASGSERLRRALERLGGVGERSFEQRNPIRQAPNGLLARLEVSRRLSELDHALFSALLFSSRAARETSSALVFSSSSARV